MKPKKSLKGESQLLNQCKNKKTKQIETCLLDTCKGDYVNKGGNFNWNKVRKHNPLIENYCKKFLNGRIPGKDTISNI